MTKKFTHRNDGFECQNCSHTVPAAEGTCRNHCTKCLYSLHVDVHPGDRACACHGKMKPTKTIVERTEFVALLHTCETCGHVQRNRLAPDDDREAIFQVYVGNAVIKP